jgi:hypothetical protein
MYKTRKHRKTEVFENETEEFQNAVTIFDYETEWDQAYFSKKDLQSSQAKTVKRFQKSVEKYIQARIKIHNHARLGEK